MINNLKNPYIIGVISGLSTAKATIANRSSHTFLYKIDGESVYYLRNQEVFLTPGTILYIPQGETYSFCKTSPGESHYSLINFHADVDLPTYPKLYTLGEDVDVAYLFSQLERRFRQNSAAAQLECLSLFYRLMSELVKLETSPYLPTYEKDRIEPAVQYLHKHLYDKSLKTTSLGALCGLSGPTFRKLFLSRFGTTPKRYIHTQKMKDARIILESGEYENISQVATILGFEDPLYFSKCFKALYGVWPSQYRQERIIIPKK